MIYYYNVSVIVPDTSIIGGSEYHVDMGSAIQLTCIIRNVKKKTKNKKTLKINGRDIFVHLPRFFSSFVFNNRLDSSGATVCLLVS